MSRRKRPGQPIGNSIGRTSRRWRRIVKAQRAKRLPCGICGQPIDYKLKHPDPGSFQADHVLPRETHPELAEDPGNVQSSHFSCNLAKRNGNQPPGLGLRSEDW